MTIHLELYKQTYLQIWQRFKYHTFLLSDLKPLTRSIGLHMAVTFICEKPPSFKSLDQNKM